MTVGRSSSSSSSSPESETAWTGRFLPVEGVEGGPKRVDVLGVPWGVGLGFEDVWEALVFTILSMVAIKSSDSASALAFDLAEEAVAFSAGAFSTGVFLAGASPP